MEQTIGNYSNGCYCEKNNQCSSWYCWDRQCRTIASRDYGFWCDYDMDCAVGRCDFKKHMCTPWCKIGGCFCTLDDDCDSHICYKFYCKSISFVPAWTLTVGAFIIITITVLCCLYCTIFKRQYLIANQVPNYGVVSEFSHKSPEVLKIQGQSQGQT